MSSLNSYYRLVSRDETEALELSNSLKAIYSVTLQVFKFMSAWFQRLKKQVKSFIESGSCYDDNDGGDDSEDEYSYACTFPQDS